MSISKSKPSVLKHADGEFYTRYFAKAYDTLTTLSGWKRHIMPAAFLDLPKGRLLDVGCGTGDVLNEALLRGYNATGIDASEGMVQKAKTRHGLDDQQIKVSLADDLPFADQSFDAGIASGSLVHIPQIQGAVKEIHRVLKPGGIMRILDHAVPVQKSITTPIFWAFSHASGDILHDYKHYFENGFELVDHKTIARGGYLQKFDFKKI
ncbi:MAG: methyltransferase domain-containing protein [Deltaproteobacteria bacterium]|nr:methyltransferase domain-containing protein [Deltaproteobacteria bacterium]